MEIRQQIERYRTALPMLWQTALGCGLVEGEFAGFSREALAEKLEAGSERELFAIADECRPGEDVIFSRGGERVRFFGAHSSELREVPLTPGLAFTPLVVDAEGTQMGLTRNAADGGIYLSFLEGQKSRSYQDRRAKTPASFVLTRHFEKLPETIRTEIESGLPLALTAARLLDPDRTDPRFPPLDFGQEMKDKSYLLFLLPAFLEFALTLFIEQPVLLAKVHLVPALVLLVAFLYTGTFRRPRLRLATVCFLAGGLALSASHTAALWLRGGIGGS